MKYITTIQSILIVLLFIILFEKENIYTQSVILQKKSDSTYFSKKDSIYYSTIIDSVDNELLNETINVGRYEAALETIDEKCKQQFMNNCKE